VAICKVAGQLLVAVIMYSRFGALCGDRWTGPVFDEHVVSHQPSWPHPHGAASVRVCR